MLHPLLGKYIPSRSYVRYLQETGASFTEFEVASILHQIGLPVETEMETYRALLGEAADEELRRQLTEELARLERVLKLFKAGGAGIAYLTLEDTAQEEMIGIAGNYETAYALGVHNGGAFQIKKYRLLTEYPSEPVLQKCYLNPNLSDSGDWRDCVETYEETDHSRGIGKATFQKDGTLLYVWSGEEEERLSDEEHLRRSFAPESFTNAYIDYPNPFECGDVVTLVSLRGEAEKDEIGIVGTSQEVWEDFRRRVKNRLYVDQIDASLTVQFLTEDGRFSHEHIPPIRLERCALEKDDPRYEVVEAARMLAQGEGSLEWFGICSDAYRAAQCRKNAPKDFKGFLWQSVSDAMAREAGRDRPVRRQT